MEADSLILWLLLCNDVIAVAMERRCRKQKHKRSKICEGGLGPDLSIQSSPEIGPLPLIVPTLSLVPQLIVSDL